MVFKKKSSRRRKAKRYSKKSRGIKGYAKKSLSGVMSMAKELPQLKSFGYGLVRNDIATYTAPVIAKIPIVNRLNPMYQDNLGNAVVGVVVGTFVDRELGVDIIKAENFMTGMEVRAGIKPTENSVQQSNKW